MDPSRFSFMSPLGYQSNTCGYCHSKPKKTSLNFYAHSSQKVLPEHYQGLVDRGWRRSGTTYYKPDVKHACCPHYTIRLDAAEFKPSKAQRGAVNKFNDYILGVEYKRQAAKLCPKTRHEKQFRRNNFNLGDNVHAAEYTSVRRPHDKVTSRPIEPAHKFEVSLEKDNYTEEKYRLFAQYQRLVHKEPPSKISMSSFKSFLCSGLGQSVSNDGGKQRQLGSYHQCYRLDGKLVAIGVLDLLPHCVSSVYLIYDDSVSGWAFGKLSAMQEISLAQKQGHGYYYMGFYIHSCLKMRYKATFKPSLLLDPETYEWNTIDKDLLKRLDTRTYVSLSRDKELGLGPEDKDPEPSTDWKRPDSVFDADMPGVMTKGQVAEIDLAKIKAGLGNEIFLLGHLGSWQFDDQSSPLTAIAEFVACVGKELAKEIVVMFM